MDGSSGGSTSPSLSFTEVKNSVQRKSAMDKDSEIQYKLKGKTLYVFMRRIRSCLKALKMHQIKYVSHYKNNFQRKTKMFFVCNNNPRTQKYFLVHKAEHSAEFPKCDETCAWKLKNLDAETSSRQLGVWNIWDSQWRQQSPTLHRFAAGGIICSQSDVGGRTLWFFKTNSWFQKRFPKEKVVPDLVGDTSWQRCLWCARVPLAGEKGDTRLAADRSLLRNNASVNCFFESLGAKNQIKSSFYRT